MNQVEKVVIVDNGSNNETLDMLKDIESNDEVSQMICAGLGGKKNISTVDCCATRLRCDVFEADKVNDALLKSTGASGVIHKGQGVQIIYGPKVAVIKSNLEEYLETAPDEETGFDVAESDSEEKNETTGTKLVKTIVIASPVDGIAADITTAPDEGFAGKMMGDGAVIEPLNNMICAPVNGEVSFVFPTKHAIGLKSEDGIEMLLHIGIDTVKLNGEGFEVFVEEGAKIKKGDILMKIDLDYVKEHAPSIVSPILCTELENNEKIRLLKTGNIKTGEDLYAVDIYE